MEKTPLSKKKTTDLKDGEKTKTHEVSFNLIMKAHDWFKCNRRFETSEMYSSMNNTNQYIQT